LDILGIIKREGAIAQMIIPDNFIPVHSSKGNFSPIRRIGKFTLKYFK